MLHISELFKKGLNRPLAEALSIQSQRLKSQSCISVCVRKVPGVQSWLCSCFSRFSEFHVQIIKGGSSPFPESSAPSSESPFSDVPRCFSSRSVPDRVFMRIQTTTFKHKPSPVKEKKSGRGLPQDGNSVFFFKLYFLSNIIRKW